MDKEECIYYEAISRKDKMCKSFNGDINRPRQIDNCRHHCSTMEFKRMMEQGEVYERHHGRLRRK